jgi:hypothetical protein
MLSLFQVLMALSEALELAGETDEAFTYQTEALELAATVDAELLDDSDAFGQDPSDAADAESGNGQRRHRQDKSRLLDGDESDGTSEVTPESVIRDSVASMIDQLGGEWTSARESRGSGRSTPGTPRSPDAATSIREAERFLQETVNKSGGSASTIGGILKTPAAGVDGASASRSDGKQPGGWTQQQQPPVNFNGGLSGRYQADGRGSPEVGQRVTANGSAAGAGDRPRQDFAAAWSGAASAVGVSSVIRPEVVITVSGRGHQATPQSTSTTTGRSNAKDATYGGVEGQTGLRDWQSINSGSLRHPQEQSHHSATGRRSPYDSQHQPNGYKMTTESAAAPASSTTTHLESGGKRSTGGGIDTNPVVAEWHGVEPAVESWKTNKGVYNTTTTASTSYRR